jgi:phosphoserine phosphatase
MQLVSTLVSAPDRADLGADAVDRFRGAVADAGGAPGRPFWLAPDIACDIAIDGLDLGAARLLAADIAAACPVDAVVQPADGRRKSLLIADMDATIVTGETLDELAAQAGLKDRISAITARAMRGEIDFEGALRERVGMLRGLPVSALRKTFDAIALTPGARTLVQTMRAHDAYTVLVSGGFRFFTSRIAAAVGFHEDQANDLVIERDRLTGEVVEPILGREAKLRALHRFAALRGTPISATLATGDGANDLAMIQAAGLGVAFHAKPVVEAEAPAAIRHGDLTALLYIQGYRAADFRP